MVERSARVVVALLSTLVVAGCAGMQPPDNSADFPTSAFPEWAPTDPQYRIFPGDTVRVSIRTAPELNSELTVAPDGRLTLPLVGAIRVAGLTVDATRDALKAAYSADLRDASLEVTPIAFGSQQIFVGGEVRAPGVYALPGAIDPLQAILLAGGWTDQGKPAQVIVMRRAPGGELMTRTLNMKKGISSRTLGELGQLQRFDVVYVSRKAIADENLFVQQFIRDALPVNFGLYYDVTQF